MGSDSLGLQKRLQLWLILWSSILRRVVMMLQCVYRYVSCIYLARIKPIICQSTVCCGWLLVTANAATSGLQLDRVRRAATVTNTNVLTTLECCVFRPLKCCGGCAGTLMNRRPGDTCVSVRRPQYQVIEIWKSAIVRISV
jgi:hypothetical protein